ncbi:MAG TPA: TonB-dependent receptor, partial [Balneolaceae bacterium]|nr:TonB-dependent receptor [Balneolaceae bacterium]
MNKITVSILTLILLSPFIQAQQIDTLQGDLGEVVVTGFEGNRSVMETPGAITNIDAERVSGFDETSLLFGLNTVPGVRIEQRAPGSYR